jgi:hypothetical protein
MVEMLGEGATEIITQTGTATRRRHVRKEATRVQRLGV